MYSIYNWLYGGCTLEHHYMLSGRSPNPAECFEPAMSSPYLSSSFLLALFDLSHRFSCSFPVLPEAPAERGLIAEGS